MSPWWPWHDDKRPARVELTARGHLVVLEARVDQVDAIIRDALPAAENGMVSVDVLFDIQRALHPVKLRRPSPGPDGSGA